ncbi:unnamed protein product [Caenorhabditis angaria]|uniref:EGF-like domain-containing protein n=1 Tax=Caenorhabditis angaria TaxID=860376 RepID=A0A9P1ING3_9PELO|nr:unnamed protein product [Caenorhabditis angaria]
MATGMNDFFILTTVSSKININQLHLNMNGIRLILNTIFVFDHFFVINKLYTKMRLLYPIFVFTITLFYSTFASELTRCCAGGTRHFKNSGTCSSIKSEGTSMTCQRSASICCLRSLLDSACDDGANLARDEESCPASINVLAGGIKKECCDCCMLAQDLLSRNEPCVAPIGFSAACLRSFNKCCNGDIEITQATNLVEDQNEATMIHLGSDRCSPVSCEHLCHDRGGDTVECSCRAGYDLAPDGYGCVDRNECLSSLKPCLPSEECHNTRGSYYCQRRITRLISSPSLRTNRVNRYRMRDDPNSRTYSNQLREAQGHPETTCPYGWTFQNNHCVDIDECATMMDDCIEGQRCLNIPGSFKCIRTLSCGTGYAMDSATEQCKDVDECNLGAHDCGVLYQCRNTQGSYRCDPKKCGDGELQNPQTGECTSITCPHGYYPKNGMCNDIDECSLGDKCSPTEECVNTPGSYRCQQKGNLCTYGYEVNEATGFCEDINECNQGVCGSMECSNLPGTYKCKCLSGYEFNDAKKKCEDIDECKKFAGHVCDLSAECINTIGSFECKCKEGFQLAPDGRRCEDVNECLTGIARCEQKCVNIPGSYQCICDRGFALSHDGARCEDIDECSIWAGSGNDLCMGGCINTKGSYLCQCPAGYKIQADGRTCVDVDECELGECSGDDKICVNTLGSFKCHSIDCPLNYVHDSHNKNRCNRQPSACGLPEECSKVPMFITWQFISLARAVPISAHRPAITLFKVSAPNHADTEVAFELQLKQASVDVSTVMPAIRSNFLLQKGDKRNSAVVTLRDSLDGPQTVKLQLILRLSKKGKSYNTYAANLVVDVAAHKRHNTVHPPLSKKKRHTREKRHFCLIDDGYSCIKVCAKDDGECLGNHTKEVLYQFRAVPSLKTIRHPVEVSRIATHMGVPFSVDYYLDPKSRRHFKIEQERNIGIVQLIKPIRGPTVETVKVNIHTKSKTGVILAFNEAIIEVSVSKYHF